MTSRTERVLRLLTEHPGSTISRLVADGICADAAEAVDLFLELERAGLVCRSEEPPWRYSLTYHGEAEAGRLYREAREARRAER